MTSLSKEQVKAALQAYQKKVRLEAFDPIDPNSRPTPAQQEFIHDFGKISVQVIRAGNQCLAKGTLITTDKGPVPIEQIQVGDTVYSEHGKPIKVLKTFANGPKEVVQLLSRNKVLAEATEDHVWLTEVYNNKDRAIGQVQAQTRVLDGRYKISKTFAKAPLGALRVLNTYSLGALLGDGCSRQSGKKVANGCNADYCSAHESNYTWKISTVPYYEEWCKGRYAHEKITDLDVLKTWDRESLLQFVAGVYDTNGSLSGNCKSRTAVLSVGMQAKSVIDAIEYAFIALWQISPLRTIDNRAKYKNGPVHELCVMDTHAIKRMLEELGPHVISPQKQWKSQFNEYGKRSYADRVKVTLGERRIADTYDIHVDSPTNLYCLANGLVTHNSGKSATCAWTMSKVLAENHPSWKRPEEWRDEPLLLIVTGRTGKQIEESLLPKLESFLEEGEYKVIRVGNMAQKIEHVNGNRIIFQSLENPNLARERLQSYVAHGFWGDEMPPTVEVYNELIMRVQSKQGFGMFSFTPLVHNAKIRKAVDTLEPPIGKLYKFKMLDNPIYADPERKQKVLDTYAHLSAAERATRLEGEWMPAESAVWDFDWDRMVRAPIGYHASWRHVEASDPAMKSAHGFILAAQDPDTNHWYIVRGDYIRGLQDPNELFADVQRRVSSVNLTRRICDPHEAWYIGIANANGVTYSCPYDKNNRKSELIKNLQMALGEKLFIAPWCTDLIEEISGAQYADSSTGERVRIKSGSDYHLADAAQYLVDCLPKEEHLPRQLLGWQAELKLRTEEQAKKKQALYNAQKRGGVWNSSRLRKRSI